MLRVARLAKSLVTALGLSLVFTSCDSAHVPAPGPNPKTAPLKAYEGVAVIDADAFDVRLTEEGSVQLASTTRPRPNPVEFSATASGVWLAGTQSGEYRASIVYFDSGFTTECGDSTARLFALDADTTYTDTEIWPRALGAPTTADGSPRVYGDQMLWGSFCTRVPAQNGSGRHSAPLSDLRVNMAVYRYDRDDLAGVRFVRYEVVNDGAHSVPDLRVGYFADTDSPLFVTRSDGVRITFYDRDAVGYASALGLSYVYQFPFQYEGATLNPTWVSGYAFLDLPPLAHRILRRYSWQEPQGFGPGPASVIEVVRALDGLSYSGEPMIDPTTGSPSLFAFPSDPWDDPEGWVDGRDETGTFTGADVRQLLSAGPISLGAGETRSFTVVWVTDDDRATSFDSYRNVQQTLAAIRAEPSLWEFDDS